MAENEEQITAITAIQAVLRNWLQNTYINVRGQANHPIGGTQQTPSGQWDLGTAYAFREHLWYKHGVREVTNDTLDNTRESLNNDIPTITSNLSFLSALSQAETKTASGRIEMDPDQIKRAIATDIETQKSNHEIPTANDEMDRYLNERLQEIFPPKELESIKAETGSFTKMKTYYDEHTVQPFNEMLSGLNALTNEQILQFQAEHFIPPLPEQKPDVPPDLTEMAKVPVPKPLFVEPAPDTTTTLTKLQPGQDDPSSELVFEPSIPVQRNNKLDGIPEVSTASTPLDLEDTAPTSPDTSPAPNATSINPPPPVKKILPEEESETATKGPTTIDFNSSVLAPSLPENPVRNPERVQAPPSIPDKFFTQLPGKRPATSDIFDGVAKPALYADKGQAILERYKDKRLNGDAHDAYARATQSENLAAKYQGIKDFAYHLGNEIGKDGIKVTSTTREQSTALLHWAAEMGNAQAVRDIAVHKYNGGAPGIEQNQQDAYQTMRDLKNALEQRKAEALETKDDYKWSKGDQAALDTASDYITNWEEANPELKQNYKTIENLGLAQDGATFGSKL